jgi:ABC-type tungstate transport system permease subunit
LMPMLLAAISLSRIAEIARPARERIRLSTTTSDEKQLPAFLLPALLSAEKDAKIKQLKNHTGRGVHKNARWTIK